MTAIEYLQSKLNSDPNWPDEDDRWTELSSRQYLLVCKAVDRAVGLEYPNSWYLVVKKLCEAHRAGRYQEVMQEAIYLLQQDCL